MADNIFQKRTYELDEYAQLTPVEPGYEDPATLWIPIDKVTWPEAKKMSLLEFVASLHKEQGPAIVESVNINEVYNVEFSTSGYYLNINAYRVVVLPNGDTTRDLIPIKNINKMTIGFSLELYDYQAGDVVEYLAFE